MSSLYLKYEGMIENPEKVFLRLAGFIRDVGDGGRVQVEVTWKHRESFGSTSLPPGETARRLEEWVSEVMKGRQ